MSLKPGQDIGTKPVWDGFSRCWARKGRKMNEIELKLPVDAASAEQL